MLYCFLRKSTTEHQCSSLKINLSSQLFNNGLLLYRKSKAFCEFYKIVCNFIELWLLTSQWVLIYLFSLKRNKCSIFENKHLSVYFIQFLIQSVASNFPLWTQSFPSPPNPFHLHVTSCYPPLVNIQERLCHLALNPPTLMRIKMNLGPSELASVLPQAQWQQTKHDSGYTE